MRSGSHFLSLQQYSSMSLKSDCRFSLDLKKTKVLSAYNIMNSLMSFKSSNLNKHKNAKVYFDANFK